MNPIIYEVYEEFFNRYPYITKIASFDTETTGFHNSDKIIEIGATGFTFDGVDIHYIEFESFINYENLVIPEKITEITGITYNDVKDAPFGTEVFPKFNEFIKDSTLIIGHNVQFDKRMLLHNFARENVELCDMDDRIRCTLTKAKKSGLQFPDLQLSTIAQHFGYINEHAHRAKDDALTTLFVWGKLALQD